MSCLAPETLEADRRRVGQRVMASVALLSGAFVVLIVYIATA